MLSKVPHIMSMVKIVNLKICLLQNIVQYAQVYHGMDIAILCELSNRIAI